jgi:RNA polymerase sigma factor (sigma-70 family)
VDVPTVAAYDLPTLVQASSDGDQAAWNELVRRYCGLVVSVTRRYRLATADGQDVSQTVWLRLVEHLPQLRHPQALAGWLISTTRHECLRQLRLAGRTVAVDPTDDWRLERGDGVDVDSALLLAERHRALRDGLAELRADQREFLLLLNSDPPHTYAEISRILGIAVGSIGPMRGRILDRLRATKAVSQYMAATGHPVRLGGEPACR